LGKREKSYSRPQENWKDGTAGIIEVKKGVWEGRIRENTDKEGLRSYYRSQRNIQTQKGRDLLFVQEWERRDSEFHRRPVKEEIY